MLTTRLNRNILSAALTTLLLSAPAIAPASAAVKKALDVIKQSHSMDCLPQGNVKFPAIRIAPADTIRLPAPVGVPLSAELNDRFG